MKRPKEANEAIEDIGRYVNNYRSAMALTVYIEDLESQINKLETMRITANAVCSSRSMGEFAQALAALKKALNAWEECK